MSTPYRNIFLPVQDEGRERILATAIMGGASLQSLGRDLWLGSRGIGLQIKLASHLGGAMAQTMPDGSFDQWFDAASALRGGFHKALRAHGACAGISERELHAATALLYEGTFPEALEAILARIPLRDRLGGALSVGEPHSSLLDTPSPTFGDLPRFEGILPGGSDRVVPIACAERSAALLAGIVEGAHDGGDDARFEPVLDFKPAYFFWQGRWMTPLTDHRRRRLLEFDGAPRLAVWVPVSQALALMERSIHIHGDVEHLLGGLSEEDRLDLIAIARAAPPKLFFEGDPRARAWFEAAEMGMSAAPAPRSQSAASL